MDVLTVKAHHGAVDSNGEGAALGNRRHDFLDTIHGLRAAGLLPLAQQLEDAARRSESAIERLQQYRRLNQGSLADAEELFTDETEHAPGDYLSGKFGRGDLEAIMDSWARDSELASDAKAAVDEVMRIWAEAEAALRIVP